MEQNIPITTSQSVRFGDTLVQFPTVVLNGVRCLRLQDVQRRFRSVSALYIGNTQLSFLYDENGHDLIPLRIEACTDKVIEAVEPIGQPNADVSDQLQRIEKNVEVIRDNTQETLIRLKHVMTQMYELQEFTTPRYFIILPAKHHDWKVVNNVNNLFHLHYKLYFLCECSDEPDKLHVAPHDGYSIKTPTEFITKYGPYLQATLNVARVMLTVGAFVVPQLGHASTTVNHKLAPVFDKLEKAEWTNKLAVIEHVLHKTSSKLTCIDPVGIAGKRSQSAPLQGAELRELESYLEVIDSKNSLGNLYRTVTDDGHVRWVCIEHYNDIGFNRKMSDYIRQFEAFGGKFNKDTNAAIVNQINLTTKNIDMFCDFLTKGFNILSLTFEKCSFNENDLDKLFEIVINRSSIRCLVMSNITIKVRQWLLDPEYISGCMSVHINNNSLKIQFFKRFQDGDMKLLVRLWLQNKICRAFDLSGGDFSEHWKDLQRCLQKNQESTTLSMKHLNNIEFLCDILDCKSSLNHLKLSFWLSSSSTVSRFCKVLETNSTLVELSITDHHCIDQANFINKLLNTVRGHKSIKRLTFHVYYIKPSNEKEACLIETLLHDSFISRLHISESVISTKFVEALSHAAQKINSLTHLEFYDCQINDDDISALQLLHVSESLTHLTFSKEQYWFVAITEMRRQLQDENIQYENKKIEQIIRQKDRSDIDLYKQELTDRDMEIVIKKAIIDKQCISLYLGSNNITSIGISILADSLKNNNTLERLWLYDNQVCDDGVYSLAKILSINNRSLKKLDLGKNNITDEAVKHLAQMLKTNKTLISLYLNENEITDQGVRILANTIRNRNAPIEVLYLSKNKLLTDLSVDALLHMIQQNQSLKDLRLCDCNLSGKGKQRLQMSQKANKNLKVWV